MDDDIRALLEENPNDTFRQMKEEELYRLKYEKFRFYEPTGKGEEFIEMVCNGQSFIILFSAANGTGKTCVSANTIAHFFWRSDNPYFQQEFLKKFPYPKKARIVAGHENIKNNLVPTLEEWFPKNRYTVKKGSKNFKSLWETDTGWSMDIMTYDQDPKEFESVTLGLVWFDEPPPQAIFKAAVSRMRKGGIIFITATPLEGSGWMYDSFINGKYEIDMGKKKYTRKVAYLEADVETACIEHGVRGFLKHKDIEAMIAEYTEDEKLARIEGKFHHLIGRIYKQWDRKIHVIKPFEVTLEDFVVYEALDPHPRVNDAILWVAIDRKGTKYIVDELWIKAQTKELANRIKSKASNYRIVRRLADPSAFIEDKHTEKSLATMLQKYGLHYLEASKTRKASDRRIGDALDYQMVNDEFLTRPELYVFDTCERFIYEIEHYHWSEWRGKQGDERNLKQTPVDKDDHFIECLGRILIQEPQFILKEEDTYFNEREDNEGDPFE